MTIRSKQFWVAATPVCVLAVLALAVRLYGLTTVPPGLHSDEAFNGLDTLDILAGQNPIFFERNVGREPLFLYLQAAFVALLGPTAFALRLPAALVGSATVLTTWWMVREAFRPTPRQARELAWWTALFLAFSYWHISFSRLGYRVIMLPLLSTIAFAWLWRAWAKLESNERFPWTDLLLCGVFAGASLYTYIASRVVPVLLVVIFLLARLGATRAGGSAANKASPRVVQNQRLSSALAVVGFTALLVFLPLGWYFVQHPHSFLGRLGEVSVLNAGNYQGNPLQTLLSASSRTVGMFFAKGDSAWRQNPAQRPLLDLPLAIWVGAGMVIIVIARRRSLPHLFALAWCLLFFLPAGLSITEVPNSLRALGMAPGVCLVGVIGLLAGARWAGKRWRPLAQLLPLLFLLFSAFTGVYDYATSWQRNQAALSEAFDSPYVETASLMKRNPTPDGIWLFPVYPIYSLPNIETAFDFLSQHRSSFAADLVFATEGSAPSQLRRSAEGRRYGTLLQWPNASLMPDGAFAPLDVNHVVSFLLEKYGRLIGERSDGQVSLSTYELPTDSDFQIATKMKPSGTLFGRSVKLTGVAYGHTAIGLDEPAAALEESWLPSGHPGWAVLRWEPAEPVANDALKVSLFLTDDKGHLAGQVDDALRSDRYIFDKTWQPGQVAQTYLIMPTLAGVPPGHYKLYAAVYDSHTLHRLPATTPTGSSGSAALLGSIEVTRSITTPVVQPNVVLPSGTFPGEAVGLIGFEPPSSTFNPGDTVPLTLFWEARRHPVDDYMATVRLQNASGQAIAENIGWPGGSDFPTSSWRSGEIVRNWHDVAIPSRTPPGKYQLVVDLSASGQVPDRISLAQIEVAGRPHIFTPPEIQHPLQAALDNKISSLGYALPATGIRAGDYLTVTLLWQTLAPVSESYTVFVHLLSPDGRVVAQHDSSPGQGSVPTTSWIPGEFIADSHPIALPADLPPGRYRIEIGMYDPSTGTRLPVLDLAGGAKDDRILLPESLDVLSR